MAVQMLMVKGASLENEEAFLTHFGISDIADNFTDTGNRYVNIAYQLHIVDGVGKGLFNPYGEITRQSAATLLRNAAAVYEFTTYSAPSVRFNDIGAVSSWALGGVNFASATGIMNGSGGNNFSPQGRYTRESAIITMLKLFEAFPREYYPV